MENPESTILFVLNSLSSSMSNPCQFRPTSLIAPSTVVRLKSTRPVSLPSAEAYRGIINISAASIAASLLMSHLRAPEQRAFDDLTSFHPIQQAETVVSGGAVA